MSFKESDSIDALIATCQQESEAVQLPDADAVVSESAISNVHTDELCADVPVSDMSKASVQPDVVSVTDSGVQKQDEIEERAKSDTEADADGVISAPHKKKPMPAYGKHGRALKTDPYGNPIRKRKQGAPLRSKTPVNTVTPADIHKPQVSFMNSVANVEPAARSAWTGATAHAYDHAVLREDGAEEGASRYSPKIRRMRDSTRAKEAASRKKKRRSGMPYEKDSPVAENHLRFGARRRKKKKSDDKSSRIPEKLMEQPYEESAPIQYMEKAAQTSIDLSFAEESAENIDIDVRYSAERRPRMDLPKQEKRYRSKEDGKNIRSNLADLQIALTLRMVFLIPAAVCSAVLSVLNLFSFPLPTFLSVEHSPQSVALIQLLLGAICIVFSGELLKSGLVKLLHLRPDSDSMASISLISAELAAVLTMVAPRMMREHTVSLYISVALLAVCMNTIARRMIVTRAQRNFAVLSDGEPKYAVHYVENESRAENLTRGNGGAFPIMATMRPADQINDFWRYSFSSDLGDRICRYAVPIVTAVAALFAILLALVRRDTVENALCYGFSVFALCFSAASCAAIPLVSNLPMDTGTKRYVRNHGMLLGYQSIDDFYDINTVMVDITTLFPQGTGKLSSIQVIGESHIEVALCYAAALTHRAGSVLKDSFAAALVAEENALPAIDNYAYEEGKGVSGWIDNKRVLLGTRELMTEHNIAALPAYAKELELTGKNKEAVYLSVSGTAVALFIIEFSASRAIKRWLHELEREHMYLLIRSNDAMLSQRRIAKMFDFPEHLLKVIPSRLEPEYEAETAPLQEASPTMLCAGRLSGFVQTLVGAKRIRRAANLGAILQVASAALGLLYAMIFLLIGAEEDVSGGVVLLYQLATALVSISVVHLQEV